MTTRADIPGLCLLAALALLALPGAGLAQGASSSSPSPSPAPTTPGTPRAAAPGGPSLAIPEYGLTDDRANGGGGPVVNGRRRQPTRMEVQEKLGAESADKEVRRNKEAQDLYEEIMRNSAPPPPAK